MISSLDIIVRFITHVSFFGNIWQQLEMIVVELAVKQSNIWVVYNTTAGIAWSDSPTVLTVLRGLIVPPILTVRQF